VGIAISPPNHFTPPSFPWTLTHTTVTIPSSLFARHLAGGPIVSSELTRLLENTKRPSILVVGDVMLDRYLWGDAGRISYEAPIPILRVGRTEDRLGGAGSVVAILAALDIDVTLAGVTGGDSEGRSVRGLLDDLNVAGDCILVDDGRPTTLKERLLGSTQSRHPQQMIRIDREDTRPISDELTDELLAAIRPRLDSIDAVLISDYDKGVCSSPLIKELIRILNSSGIPTIADPARGVDYGRYTGATCVTPNRSEAGIALGCPITTVDDGLNAARAFLELGIESVVVTLDRDGIAWADQKGRSQVFPVKARQVHDITGAGDAVLGALGFAVAAGADWPAAIELANLAGGLEVQRLGVSPLTRREILDEISLAGFATTSKIVTVKELQPQLRERRKVGQQIAMTNGCFDLLHPGHVASLQHARSHGDCLVVGLNSDRSARTLKGPGHPIIDQQGRAEVLSAMACVDFVVIFDDPSVAELVQQVAPDVLVKAAQYNTDQVVGHEIVEAHGGRVVLAPMKDTYSTTKVIERVKSR
jgi:D-beta-D-heptose 7-phosphate kinase / D-beta-D-heptose 1-phosphate adenosyltransferase